MRQNLELNIVKNVLVFRKFSYDEGVSAFKEGFSLSTNPYKKTMSDHLIWHGGWMEAQKSAIEK